MHLIFADDSHQTTPTRLRMGPLAALGGIHVVDTEAGHLEHEIEHLCTQVGFSPGEEFKWSPRRTSWMFSNLHAPERDELFASVLTTARYHLVQVTVVAADASCRRANPTSSSCDHDVTTLFLERVELALRAAGTTGMVVIDRPGGGQQAGKRLLAACKNTVTVGTRFVRPRCITDVELAWSATARQFPRLLQLADLVTGCTLARVAGSPWAVPAFEFIRPLLRSDGRRIGGVGLKLHPDYTLANLYHVLVGDGELWKGMSGWPLPRRDLPYFEDAS